MDYCVREYGSEYDWLANDAFLLPEGARQTLTEGARLYRSGRDALKAAARACRNTCSRVLLPALCCESMVSPFRMNGISPLFYRLNEGYTADVADVESKMTSDTILLYGPYFGISPFDDETLSRLRRTFPGVVFLEDRTHDILHHRKDGFVSDLTVASIRKWTAVPDGGLLWSHTYSCDPGHSDLAFADLRTQAMQQKARYLASGEAGLKDSFRELLGEASELLDVSAEPCAMAEASARLLDRLDEDSILVHRQRNADTLLHLLQPAVERGQLRLITPEPGRSTLYFPILVPDQKYFQTELAYRGIYCPVIWPVPRDASGVCPVAEYTAAHMLGVPCDHRYTQADMRYIAEQIVRLCNEQ